MDDALKALQMAFAAADANKIMTVDLANDLLARCEATILDGGKPKGSQAMIPLSPEVVRELVLAWRSGHVAAAQLRPTPMKQLRKDSPVRQRRRLC